MPNTDPHDERRQAARASHRETAGGRTTAHPTAGLPGTESMEAPPEDTAEQRRDLLEVSEEEARSELAAGEPPLESSEADVVEQRWLVESNDDNNS